MRLSAVCGSTHREAGSACPQRAVVSRRHRQVSCAIKQFRICGRDGFDRRHSRARGGDPADSHGRNIYDTREGGSGVVPKRNSTNSSPVRSACRLPVEIVHSGAIKLRLHGSPPGVATANRSSAGFLPASISRCSPKAFSRKSSYASSSAARTWLGVGVGVGVRN